MNLNIVKKTYYAFLFLLIVMAVVYAAAVFFGKKNNINTNTDIVNINNNNVSGEISEKIENLRKKSELLYDDQSGKGYLLKKSDNYNILMYEKGESSFLISIIAIDNIDKIRAEAENDFLSIIGINENEACSLKVSLSVPKEASQTQIGVDYGLSFCPNGIPFEP